MNNLEVEEILAEPNEPTFLDNTFNVLISFQHYAWLILAAVAISYYIWKEKLSAKYYKWKEVREVKESSAKAKKDVEIDIDKDEARLKAIRRLQATYNQQALKMEEIRKEKEEKKKQEALKNYPDVGRKLNDNVSNSGSSFFRYTSSTRRTGCSGGC